LCVNLAQATKCEADELAEGLSAFKNGDYHVALQLLLPSATRGDAEAQYRVALIYAFGAGGVPENRGEAHKWFRRAAEQGLAKAQFQVAVQYDLGQGTARSPSEALKWYRLAADQNYADAHYYLGLSYATGDIVPKDETLAFDWFRRAAEFSHPEAELRVARAYLFGHGVLKAEAEAIFWYRRAAGHGVAAAQAYLGYLFESGKGMQQDHSEAAKWYLAAAEQDHPIAQLNLARLYLQGRGVRRDLSEALRWFKRAAAAGDPDAQIDLGVMYYRGEGVEENKAEALRWFRVAADQGHGEGQYRVAIAYRYGWTVPQDYVVAYMWANLAAAALTGERGGKAAELRDDLAKLLSPGQLARAQNMSRDWKPVGPGVAKREEAASQQSPGQHSASPDASGSGFFVTRIGHILTNFHVVDGCASLRVKATGPSLQPAHVVAVDARNDLALLRTSTAGPSSMFRGGRAPRRGEGVVVIGYPLRGLLASEASVTDGIVSALAGPQNDTRYLQFTAPVQPGNSGGPLLDESGNVIGVVVAKLNAIELARTTGDLPQNVNFAISGAVVRAFLDANDISYDSAASLNRLTRADISDQGLRFTVAVECQR
jgi:TPR repeat protein